MRLIAAVALLLATAGPVSAAVTVDGCLATISRDSGGVFVLERPGLDGFDVLDVEAGASMSLDLPPDTYTLTWEGDGLIETFTTSCVVEEPVDPDYVAVPDSPPPPDDAVVEDDSEVVEEEEPAAARSTALSWPI